MSLSTFGDPEKSKSFDYGGRRFDLPELGDDDDDDDDNMDIVDLSLLNSNSAQIGNHGFFFRPLEWVRGKEKQTTAPLHQRR